MARDPFARLSRTLADKTAKAAESAPVIEQGKIPPKRSTAPAGKSVAPPPSRDRLARAVQSRTSLPAVEPGDTETAAAEELSEMLKGFKGRAKVEDDRFELATDGGFYAVLVFPTTAHRDAFFTAVKCPEARDLNFINGMHLAERMKLSLPPVPKMSTAGRSSLPWLAVGTMPVK